jgi:hypothetical protein
MSNTEKIIKEFYEMRDGVPVLMKVIEDSIEVISIEEEIALKEAELLRVYQEIQALKEANI